MTRWCGWRTRSFINGGLAVGVAAFLASARWSSAEMPIETQLEQLRNIYDSNCAAIRKRHDDSLAAWPQAYAADLKLLQKRAQTAGDFESWMAIQSELERFERDRLVRDANIVKEPAPLLEMQQKYKDSDIKIDKTRDDDLATLRDKYVAALSRLQSNLTRAGKIQDAIKVNDEIKRLQGSSGNDGDAGQSTGETTGESKPVPQPPDAGSTLNTTQAGGFTFYTGGVPPPIRGVVLKAMPVFRSESLKAEQRVSITSEIGMAPPASRETGAEYLPYRSNTQGGRIYHTRLGMKPQSETSMGNAIAFVQYYARELAEQDSGRFTRVCEDITTVADIPADGVTVDCPPVILQGPVAGPTGSAGQEMYGVIATLFDSSHGVLAQVCSGPTLARLASQSYPANAEEILARRAYEEAREQFYRARSERTRLASPESEEACEKARAAYYAAQKNYQAKRTGVVTGGRQ